MLSDVDEVKNPKNNISRTQLSTNLKTFSDTNTFPNDIPNTLKI